MTPVFPYLVRRSEDGRAGELLLRLKEGKSVFVVHLSMEQARILAVEMRGLATDHCPNTTSPFFWPGLWGEYQPRGDTAGRP